MYELTKLKEGQVFKGFQQYFEVLSIDDDKVTIYIRAGDFHRVQKGSTIDVCKMLMMSLNDEPSDEIDDYFCKEHPELENITLFPDDYEYEED